MSDFSDWLVSQTPNFDAKILQSLDPKAFMGEGKFMMKRGRREPDPLRAAIRKARREARKNLTATPPKA